MSLISRDKATDEAELIMLGLGPPPMQPPTLLKLKLLLPLSQRDAVKAEREEEVIESRRTGMYTLLIGFFSSSSGGGNVVLGGGTTSAAPVVAPQLVFVTDSSGLHRCCW